MILVLKMCEFGFDYEYSAYLSTRDDCVDLQDQVREMLLLYDTLGYSAKSAIQELFPNISLEFQGKFTYVDTEAYGYIEAKVMQNLSWLKPKKWLKKIVQLKSPFKLKK